MTTEQLTVTHEYSTISKEDEYTSYSTNSTEDVYTSVTTTTSIPTFNVTTSIPKDNSNVGLIVGLSVGIPCAVAVIVAVIVTIICLRRRRNNDLFKRKDSKPTNSLYEPTIPTIAHNPTESNVHVYENVSSTRNNPIYVNHSAPENIYETRLPAS